MDQRMRVEDLRRQLLEIDIEILHAVERRARLAQEVSKARSGSARYAPLADGLHLAALEKAVSPPIEASSVRPIFTAIDSACRVFEVSPRVAFVAPDGGFAWLTARSHFGVGADLVRVETAAAALEEVARSRAEFAVIPYESHKDGPIFPTIQAIAALDLKLVGERQIPQSLALVNSTGNPADAEKIYISSQDRAACVNYLESNHPKAHVVEVHSAIMALELALEGPGSAAVVPKALTETDDLRVARENIADDGEAPLRYGVISRLPAQRTGSDATALLFSVQDHPGALHDILHFFKERNCNLRRIQSRRIADEGWDHVFYVEVNGHVTDRPLVAALEGVKREAKMIKIIGSFPLEFPETNDRPR